MRMYRKRSPEQGFQRSKQHAKSRKSQRPRARRSNDLSHAAAVSRVHEFAQRVWQALDSPMSKQLSLAARSRDWETVARQKIVPSSYSDPMRFFLDYQACKLMSKNPLIPTGIDCRKAAEKKFIEAEVQCRDTNERFHDTSSRVNPRLSRVLHMAQRKIADILGDVPTFEELDLAFGPGAAFGVRGKTSVFHKVTSTLESTHSMVSILPALLGEVPGWIEAETADVCLVPGSDLSFVPKDATTDRAICIEPLLNGLLQKGIGSFIRDRLHRHGVDLSDQGINQRLAALCYTNGLATVDFSSASDTIASALVWDLLPPDWCELLDAARCPQFRYEGSWYRFQKFSSMGNAYTFELETLIFYALAYACCVESEIRPLTRVNLHVYGDDVIIPSGVYDLFREVSEYCGFAINEAKSYKDGAFYESCGCDYFAGNLVTPFRLKCGLKTTEELFYAANLTVRLVERLQAISVQEADRQHVETCCHRLADVHRWIVSLIPRYRVALGPHDEGDAWLIAPFDRVRPARGFFGWWHKQRVPKVEVEPEPPQGWPMAYALYAAQFIHEPRLLEVSTPLRWSEGASLRQRVKYRVGWTQSSDWHTSPLSAGYFWQGY